MFINFHKDKINRKLVVFILGILSAIGPFSIDMYLPAFTAIAKNFNTDVSFVGYSLTSYFVGICFGQLFYGPITDRFGRKKPLIAGLTLYTISSLGCALAPSIEILILLRLIQALGGCVGMVVSRAVIRDIFHHSQTAKVLSTMMLVMGVAPIIAPVIGGFVQAVFGWRVIFYSLVAIGLFMIALVSLFLPESNINMGENSLHPLAIGKSYWNVLKHPAFRSYGFASGILFSGLYAYIAGSPFVYMKLFDLTENQYGLAYGANALGLIIGTQTNHFLLKKYSSLRLTKIASFSQVIYGLILLLCSLIIPQMHLIVFVFVFLYLLFLGVLNPNTTALAINPFRKNAGSASSMIGFVQMLIGSIATALVSFFHNGTIFPMIIGMLLLSSTGFLILAASKQKNVLE